MATHQVLYVRWLSLFDEETAWLSHSPYNAPLTDFIFTGGKISGFYYIKLLIFFFLGEEGKAFWKSLLLRECNNNNNSTQLRKDLH